MGSKNSEVIGFIGGTGSQGRALALRLAVNGKKVVLGSRRPEKAKRAVDALKTRYGDLKIIAGTNLEAAKESYMVFVTLPYSSMKQTIQPLARHLAGKIVIDVTNPLTNGDIHKGLSASEELQSFLVDSKVVCAFKNVSSKLLAALDQKIEVNSIVCSDFEDAKKATIRLSEEIGVSSIDGGSLENALASELLTKLLIHLNKKLKAETGIKILCYPL